MFKITATKVYNLSTINQYFSQKTLKLQQEEVFGDTRCLDYVISIIIGSFLLVFFKAIGVLTNKTFRKGSITLKTKWNIATLFRNIIGFK